MVSTLKKLGITRFFSAESNSCDEIKGQRSQKDIFSCVYQCSQTGRVFDTENVKTLGIPIKSRPNFQLQSRHLSENFNPDPGRDIPIPFKNTAPKQLNNLGGDWGVSPHVGVAHILHN